MTAESPCEMIICRTLSFRSAVSAVCSAAMRSAPPKLRRVSSAVRPSTMCRRPLSDTAQPPRRSTQIEALMVPSKSQKMAPSGVGNGSDAIA